MSPDLPIGLAARVEALEAQLAEALERIAATEANLVAAKREASLIRSEARRTIVRLRARRVL